MSVESSSEHFTIYFKLAVAHTDECQNSYSHNGTCCMVILLYPRCKNVYRRHDAYRITLRCWMGKASMHVRIRLSLGHAGRKGVTHHTDSCAKSARGEVVTEF